MGLTVGACSRCLTMNSSSSRSFAARIAEMLVNTSAMNFSSFSGGKTIGGSAARKGKMNSYGNRQITSVDRQLTFNRIESD